MLRARGQPGWGGGQPLVCGVFVAAFCSLQSVFLFTGLSGRVLPVEDMQETLSSLLLPVPGLKDVCNLLAAAWASSDELAFL